MNNTAWLNGLQRELHLGHMLIGPELMVTEVYHDSSNTDYPPIADWFTPSRAHDLAQRGWRFIYLTGKTCWEMREKVTTQGTTRHEMFDHVGTRDRKPEGRYEQFSAFSESFAKPGLYMFTQNGLDLGLRFGNKFIAATHEAYWYLKQVVPEVVTANNIDKLQENFLEMIGESVRDDRHLQDLRNHKFRQAMFPNLAMVVETIIAWDHINKIRLWEDRPVLTRSTIAAGGNPLFFTAQFGKHGIFLTDDSGVPQKDLMTPLFVRIS